jgi:hypothetical protein
LAGWAAPIRPALLHNGRAAIPARLGRLQSAVAAEPGSPAQLPRLLVAVAATAVAGSGLVPLVGRQLQGDSPVVPLALPRQRAEVAAAAAVALAAMG